MRKWLQKLSNLLMGARQPAASGAPRERPCPACGARTDLPVMCRGCWDLLGLARRVEVFAAYNDRDRDAVATFHYRSAVLGAVAEAQGRRRAASSAAAAGHQEPAR